MKSDIRFDWSKEEILFWLKEASLLEVTQKAKTLHRKYAQTDVQQCQLLSIKTGACPEDCGYCSQSAHYKTSITPEKLMDVSAVLQEAKKAKENGASRFCMGTAWRHIPDDSRFEKVLEMVRGVSSLGLEACCTLGMAKEAQLSQLKEAGLTAYNHNLDTSREFYPKVTSTRTYEDRLSTLEAARRAGVQVCCGGILGLGESIEDRASLLQTLSNMNPHPESVPINLLVPVKGTPFEKNEPVPFSDFLRMIAVARIVMPQSRVRLSAGRNTLSEAQQRECFEVGANSIFFGEKLLTTANVEPQRDREMLESLSV